MKTFSVDTHPTKPPSDKNCSLVLKICLLCVDFISWHCIISRKACEASFKEAGFDYIVTEKMVCAGGEKGEQIMQRQYKYKKKYEQKSKYKHKKIQMWIQIQAKIQIHGRGEDVKHRAKWEKVAPVKYKFHWNVKTNLQFFWWKSLEIVIGNLVWGELKRMGKLPFNIWFKF